MHIGIRSAESAKPERPEGDVRKKPQAADPAFDAALLRVQAHGRRSDDELEIEPQADQGAERVTWQDGWQQLAGLRGEQALARATAGHAQLDKQNAQNALSHLQQVQTMVPTHAVPPTVPTVTAVRADLAMPQNMTVHLQQAAPGQWTMRFKTDVHTQQLVAPHLHALRDRLKGRRVQVDGFVADDDDLTG